MKTHVYHSWKGVLVTVVVMGVLGSAAQAFEAEPDSQDITLSATVREPGGETGTVASTFELEEMPTTSAVLPNYSSVPPQPSAVPEPSTLLLIVLGILGLVVWRKALIST